MSALSPVSTLPRVRTLLAATDFSIPSRHALERAAMLAREHPDSRLTLAHVLSRSALNSLHGLLSRDAGGVEARLLEHSQHRLAEMAAKLAASHGCAIETVLEHGAPADKLAELSEQQQAGLLLMGARGPHFVREHILGSTTERVLRTSLRPLLVVKQRPHSPYRRILAAVDFSAHAEAAINIAHAWLPSADIVLLHAFEVEFEATLHLAGLGDSEINQYRIQTRETAKQAMEAFIERLQVPRNLVTRLFVHGAPTLHILEQEQLIDPDLIVMGKHGLSALEELLLGSVTQHVLAYSTCDVLVAGQTH